jgi:predicted GNAT family acetyltransferase
LIDAIVKFYDRGERNPGSAVNTKKHQDEELDETIAESFPASDPPANTVETGIRLIAEPGPVRDNREANRFELITAGELAFLAYERKPDAMVFVHTDVPPSLRGQHIADTLVSAGLAAARAEGLRIVAVCPFVRGYLAKHST